MVEEVTKLIHKYLRHDKKFPHIWCPGCGNGIVLGSLIRAIDNSGLKKENVVLVSGIGCSGRITVYADFNTLHTTHGRALTFATGVKLANPSLTVIVIMGDGDATAIGGNHLIHAARRNIDLKAIIINNQNYGMTGGQHSPTTPPNCITTTTPYGQIESTFNISQLVTVAGASFVGRSTVFHTQLLDKLIEKAINKSGFSLVEVLSNCHVQFGRRNKLSSAVAMMKGLRDHAVTVEKAKGLSDEEMEGKFLIGVLADIEKPSYLENYHRICANINVKNKT
jgi:2-oxoglutarate ferredoxin oxidoreductase subunit beta